MVRSVASTLILLLAVPTWAQQPTPQPAPAPAQPPPVGTSPAPRPDAVTPPPIEPEEKLEPEAPGAVGVAVRGRFLFLPSGILNLFLAHATSLTQYSFGAAFVRRKGNFDIEFGLEYANVSPKDGYYLEKGVDPAGIGHVDRIHFDNFSMISADATFIWHSDIVPTVQVRYGAGIGIGFLLGDIIGTKQICDSSTTGGDLDNPNMAGGKCSDQPGTTATKSKPPVVPIVHLLAGIRFKLIDQLSLNVEVGIRDLPFVGINIGYFF